MIFSFKEKQNIKKAFILYFSIYCSHLLLDYISVDGRPPLGIPVFWPLCNEYFISPYTVLPSVNHHELDNSTVEQFLNGVFSIHNLYVIFLETIVILPIMAILFIVNLYRGRKI